MMLPLLLLLLLLLPSEPDTTLAFADSESYNGAFCALAFSYRFSCFSFLVCVCAPLGCDRLRELRPVSSSTWPPLRYQTRNALLRSTVSWISVSFRFCSILEIGRLHNSTLIAREQIRVSTFSRSPCRFQDKMMRKIATMV